MDINLPEIGLHLSEIEQARKWEQLKRKGVYETELGDSALQAIARGSKKDILVFNTSSRAHSLIYVMTADNCPGGERDIYNPSL